MSTKIKLYLNKIIGIIGIIFFSFVFISVILYHYEWKGHDNLTSRSVLHSVYLFCISAIFIFTGIILYRFFDKAKFKFIKKIKCNMDFFFCICLFVATLFQIINLDCQFYYHFDKDFLYNTAVEYGKNGNFEWRNNPDPNITDTWIINNFPSKFHCRMSTVYFSNYPNTWCSTLLYCFIFRATYLLFGSKFPDIFFVTASCINIFCFIISSIFFYLLLKKIFNANKTPQILAILLLFTQHTYYTYVRAFYTDTLAMPFVIIPLYLIICALESKSKLKFFVLTFLSCVLLAFGYQIKGNIAILFIAFLIYAFLKNDIKRTSVIAVLFMPLMLLFNFVIQNIAYSINFANKEDVEKYKLPFNRWIAMQLDSEVGGMTFNKSIKIDYSDNYNTKKKKLDKSIKTSLKNYGLWGLIKHTCKKNSCTWGNAMSRHNIDDFGNNKISDTALANNYTMIFFMLLSFIVGMQRNKIDGKMLIRLCVLGFTMFLMIWESHPRYLMSFSYLYFIMETEGVQYANQLITRFLHPKKKKNKIENNISATDK